MSSQETSVEQPVCIGTASETPPWHDRDLLMEPPRSIDIPPAFYRDDEVPPPPPDDPHWREWPYHYDREPVSRMLVIGLPVGMCILGVWHILLILVVLHASGLY